MTVVQSVRVWLVWFETLRCRRVKDIAHAG